MTSYLFLSVSNLPPSSPVAAVAGGDTTARTATVTGGTNTRKARGARRAKRPVMRSLPTKRTRRPWSRDQHFLFFLSLSFCLSLHVSHHEDEKEPSISILLTAVIYPQHLFIQSV